MFLRFFIWVNSKFPRILHPFNQLRKNPLTNGPLPYAEFEYEHAHKVVELYQKAFHQKDLDFQEWIKDKVIADFCCGGGGKSLYFLNLGAKKITGLDMNTLFIEQAKLLAEKKNFSKQSEFFVKNVCHTGLNAASFDAVIFNDAIDHIDQPQKAIEEALRLLKPGGLVFINFESYYFPWGHHLLDAINIPWIHLFTPETFRIKLYKKLVSAFPDGKERLKFRLGYDEKGRERITYLNHLTIRRFQKILQKIQKKGENFRIFSFYKVPFRRKILKILGKIPFLNEFFLSTHLWVLKKTDI